jgi:hypothetical protein
MIQLAATLSRVDLEGEWSFSNDTARFREHRRPIGQMMQNVDAYGAIERSLSEWEAPSVAEDDSLRPELRGSALEHTRRSVEDDRAKACLGERKCIAARSSPDVEERASADRTKCLTENS